MMELNHVQKILLLRLISEEQNRVRSSIIVAQSDMIAEHLDFREKELQRLSKMIAAVEVPDFKRADDEPRKTERTET